MNPDDVKRRDYRIYNLLVWLQKVAPDCDNVAERLKKMQLKHPDFGCREHPDFDVGPTTVLAGSQSPLMVEELLGLDLEAKMTFLLSYQGEGALGPDREGLLNSIRRAVTQSFEWGSQLAARLAQRGEWKSDIWRAIIRGWREAELTNPDWRTVLDFLAEHGELHWLVDPIADLLEDGIGKDKGQLPLSLLEQAEGLASTLYDKVSRESKEQRLEEEDWLTKSINEPPGKLAEFWINALSRIVRANKDAEPAIPDRYKGYLIKVISGTTFADQLARVVIASQLNFLFSLDAEWARDHVLPLLDWDRDEKTAEQAWHGYLIWGRWNEKLLPEILPCFVQAFTHLSGSLSGMRGQFCNKLAAIAVFSRRNPAEDGWLLEFISGSDLAARRQFAKSLRSAFDELNDGAKQDAWSRWVSRYWAERLDGKPLPLSEDESSEMVGWAVALSPVFPEVTQRIVDGPPPRLENTMLFYDLKQGDIALRFADPLANLLVYLLRNTGEPFLYCRDVSGLVEGSARAGGSSSTLLDACQELARLGCAEAAPLRAIVEGMNRG